MSKYVTLKKEAYQKLCSLIRESHSAGGSGTSDYTDLNNKPSINGVELIGNKTAAELNITADVDEEQIVSAVEAYMAENPVSNNVVYISEADYLALVANGTYNPNTIYVTEKSLLDGNEVSY